MPSSGFRLDLEPSPYGKAIVWCGYADSWQGSELTPMVRWDGLDDSISPPAEHHYGLPQDWLITFVHDVNRFGQMVVTLTIVVDPPASDPLLIEYPCVVTLAADVNGDLVVNAADLGLVLGHWWTTGMPGQPDLTFDLDGDGQVAGGD
ncbi:MAG: hypothetical protein SGJ09_01535 [Phycisphaerae bacterium]|nr:hypothetical protein [Phycisphaerae bacterium]